MENLNVVLEELNVFALEELWENACLPEASKEIKAFVRLMRMKSDILDDVQQVALGATVDDSGRDEAKYIEIVKDGERKADDLITHILGLIPESEAFKAYVTEFFEGIISYREFLIAMAQEFLSESDISGFIASKEWSSL